MNETYSADMQEIQKLLTSSYFSKLAASILAKLDRKTLANLIASYMYFKSKEKSDSEFFRFLLSKDLPEILPIVSLSVPIFLPAILSDKQIRSMVLKLALIALKGQ